MCVDDDPSPRLRLARQHVRILTWKPWDSESTFRNLPHYLNNLPNLVELCFWENFLPEFITLPGLDFETVYPKLKRIHTGSWTLQGLPPKGFDYPFWSTVTHLQIHPQFALHTETSAFTLPLFVSMKSLTHLAIGEPVTYSRIEEGERNVALDTTINRVLACFPPSLQLCLLSIPSDLIGEDTKERFRCS
ncbi:hypothetical protein DL96DRAFT_1720558 [Flagelloscypha sp. PMI_526]|nr:hypothetical protein DL96DRAFT_1720558 [Flagelloscypha sp. PMI_526]